MLLDLYKFLITLHYKAVDLKVPPVEGWLQITPEACGYFRNDYAIEVLRHLPYLNSTLEFHYKCNLLDYTTLTREHFDIRHQDSDEEEWWSTIDRVDAGWMVQLAAGYESYGRDFFLNVLDAEINEVFIRADVAGPVRLRIWIQEMKDAYCRLDIIPCPGRITMDCIGVPENEKSRIAEDEFKAQTEDWPTDLDVQYVRQVYRDHGWPYAFQRDKAFSYMCHLLEYMDNHSERSWPRADHGNDPRRWAY